MKKLVFVSFAAMMMVVAACCCGKKDSSVCVDKLIGNPAEFVGKEVTFTGKACVTNVEQGHIAVFGSDSTKYILVQAVDSAKVCPSMCGKPVSIVGTVVEGSFTDSVQVDSVTTIAFVAEKYIVSAKCIKKAECCKKDGKGCCKKDEGKGCCKKDSTSCKKDSAAAADCHAK
ncbi:MAG: hypothetical protein LBS63_01450 [Prevotellaceae bacterium]|nr:hypothetical protein [Prevotellaceae bacterium]